MAQISTQLSPDSFINILIFFLTNTTSPVASFTLTQVQEQWHHFPWLHLQNQKSISSLSAEHRGPDDLLSRTVAGEPEVSIHQPRGLLLGVRNRAFKSTERGSFLHNFFRTSWSHSISSDSVRCLHALNSKTRTFLDGSVFG